MHTFLMAFAAGLANFAIATTQEINSTYYNPVLSGWHSDPTCTQVNGTFFCTTSTFDTFPGLPVYASKDLINWKLVSHVWSRESQLPGINKFTAGQQDGFQAPNLRFHNDYFYVTSVYTSERGILGTVFKASDPYDDASWSNPLTWNSSTYDPDLFWHDDGTVYLTSSGIYESGIVQQQIDLQTGNVSTPVGVWNGTGGAYPEGPHIYQKDGYYYLMIAEGGSELNHMETIGKSPNISGPYEACPSNPMLTNANTTKYFQTVGHADLFQDAQSRWWGMALCTRSGPQYTTYPMSREACLFPVTWNKDECPFATQVQGAMDAWPLPVYNTDLPGNGPYNSDPDIVDFSLTSTLPSNFLYFRYPPNGSFTVSPPESRNALKIIPSRTNLTGNPYSLKEPELSGTSGIAFVGRRQTDTLFTYSVDLAFTPQHLGEEAGVTIFLTQVNHINLGIVRSPEPQGYGSKPVLQLRLRIIGSGAHEVIRPLSSDLVHDGAVSVRLQIRTTNTTYYQFSVMPPENPNAMQIVGCAPATAVSGGNGSYVGALVGPYATCNGVGGVGNVCPDGGEAYFSRWRYEGAAQKIADNYLVTSTRRS